MTVWQCVDLETDQCFFTTNESQAERWNNDECFEVHPSPSRRPVRGYSMWMLSSDTDKYSLQLGLDDKCDWCEHFHEMNQTCGYCGRTWSGDEPTNLDAVLDRVESTGEVTIHLDRPLTVDERERVKDTASQRGLEAYPHGYHVLIRQPVRHSTQ